MFGHPDTFPLTFHVLRLRDSGAQTQGEGEEKQSHLFSLSVNSSHFQGYGDGVKEKKKKKTSRRDGEKKEEKFFPPCALAGLQNEPLAFCLVYVLCGKVPPLCDKVGRETPGSWRVYVCQSVCVSVCV